jgi:hypothetical protein
MKIQASLEFLLILSAISLLALSVIIIYGSSIKPISAALSNSISNLNNTQRYVNNSYIQDPKVIAYIPSNSTVGIYNSIDIAFYGCKSGIANFNINSNSLRIENNKISNMSIDNIGIENMQFITNLAGYNYADLNYSITCGEYSHSGHLNMSTFAENSSQPTGPSKISAYISERNETISYNINPAIPIYYIGERSHCTFNSFSGAPFPVWMQCRTSDSWDYMVFSSSCYTSGQSLTEVYCMYPEPTGYSIEIVNLNNVSFIYSFSLLIGSNLGTISGHMHNKYGNLTLSGALIGNATVVQVSGTGLTEPVSLINNGKNIGIVNENLYQVYTQYMSTLSGTLSYYNSTEVSSNIQSEINQEINSLNKASSSLVSSEATNVTGCIIYQNTYRCKATIPFSYEINASINNIGIENSTLYTAGSIINLKN